MHPISFALFKNVPLKIWNSHPQETIGHQCHENCIYHGGNVFKKINGAFYVVYCKIGSENTNCSRESKRTEDRERTLWRELGFSGINGRNILKEKDNNGINEQQNVMKVIYHPMKTFFTPWMQFS